VVVDALQLRPNQIMLIQQPEVHLHPRAQAALGTFFCDQVANHKKAFVIETHSDYLVDRIRMAVAAGTLPPASVNIAFLERVKLDVRINELALDDMGNIVNAPPSYRRFFLQEEQRLLFRGGAA
jgi:predicted ATPase